MTWEQITGLTLKDAIFGGKKLIVDHAGARLPVSQTTLRLYGLKSVAAFANTLSLYRQRYHTAVHWNGRAG